MQPLSHLLLLLAFCLPGVALGQDVAVPVQTNELQNLSCIAAPGLTCELQMDQTVLLAGQDNKALVQLTVDAHELVENAGADSTSPPIHLCIVLDRSGSMKGAKLEAAKESVRRAAAAMRPNDRLALVTFGDRVDTLLPCQTRAALDASKGIDAVFEALRPTGDTALFGGLSRAAAELRPHLKANAVHRLLLISDGAANKGPSSTRHLLRLATSVFKENMSISAFGLGDDFNEELLAGLAGKSDGNFHFVENPSNLPALVETEVKDLFDVVAQNVMLEFICPPGVTPLRLIGREGVINGDTAEVVLNQLQAGRQQVAVLEVELNKGHVQEQRMIDANVYFRNGLTRANSVANLQANWSFSDDAKKVIQSQNRDVWNEAGRGAYANATQQAVAQSNVGNYDEAQAILRRESFNQLSIAKETQHPEFIENFNSLQALEQQVGRQQPLDSVQRKQLIHGSYRTVTQRVMTEPPRLENNLVVQGQYETRSVKLLASENVPTNTTLRVVPPTQRPSNSKREKVQGP